MLVARHCKLLSLTRLCQSSAASRSRTPSANSRACSPKLLFSKQTTRCAAMVTTAKCDSLMPGFKKCVEQCNDADGKRVDFVPFSVEGKTVGYMLPSFTAQLADFGDVFKVTPEQVTLDQSLSTPETRTKAVATVMAQLRDSGVITGWRDELFPVSESFSAEPLLLVERAAASMFGIKAYGVHINGYVKRADGSMAMWVARRSKTKQTWPGMLDHIVAGGQPHGISPKENVVKECGEEAGIPEKMAMSAIATGAVSYECINTDGGLKRDVMFVYDLCLPEEFVPEPQDGEVEEFFLWPVEKVMEVVAEGGMYKPNCSLVILDFLLRNGQISPEQDGYLELLASLRQGECS